MLERRVDHPERAESLKLVICRFGFTAVIAIQ